MHQAFHLDSEYRHRWQEYHTGDGKLFDSRKVYWRQVDWERVVKIVTYLNGRVHSTDCSNPNFLFFLCFRWGGHTWNGSTKVPIKLWTVGWSDGEKAFLNDYDFKTGEQVKKYVAPSKNFYHHIHPRVLRKSLCLQR
jgi:hypothetical protein